MAYRLDVVDGGTTVTAVSNSKIVYSGSLNSTRFFDVVIEGVAEEDLVRYEKGSTVKIYRDGTLEQEGIVEKRHVMPDGSLRLVGLGSVEKKLDKPDAPAKRTSQWTSLNTTGVIGDILANCPAVTSDIIDNVAVTSFRTEKNQSCLVAISRFCTTANQYWIPIYSTGKIQIKNATSVTPIKIFNENIDTTPITVIEDDQGKVTRVRVIGKSEGSAQILGTYGPSFAQGDNEVTITDKTIETVAEANARAQLEYNIRSLTRYSYKFHVLDPAFTFTLGDVITLRSKKISGGTADLRITSFTRSSSKDGEDLYIEVRGTTEREASEDKLKRSAMQSRFSEDANVFEQGDIVPLTYTSNDQAGSTSSKYAGGTFILPNWITSTSQILEAKLTIKRLDLKFATGTITGTGFASKVSNNPSVSGNAASHQHSIVNETPTTTSSGGASVISSVGSSSTNDTTLSALTGMTSTGLSVSGGLSDTAGMHIYANVHDARPNTSVVAGVRNLLMRWAWQDDIGNWFPSTAGAICNISVYGVKDANNSNAWTRGNSSTTFIIPTNTNGRTYTLYMANDISDAVILDLWAMAARINQHSHSVASHNHGAVTNSPSLSGNATSHDHSVDSSGHTNPISQGVFNGTETNPLTIRYDVNATTANGAGNMSVGDVTAEFDIKAMLNNPVSNRTNNIFFYPTSNEAYLYAVVTIKAYRSE